MIFDDGRAYMIFHEEIHATYHGGCEGAFFFGYEFGLSFFLTLRLVAEDNGCHGLEVEMATGLAVS